MPDVAVLCQMFLGWSAYAFSEDSFVGTVNGRYDVRERFSRLDKELRRLLFESRDLTDMLRLTEALLLKKLETARKNGVINRAIYDILRSQGTIGINQLSKENFISSRQMELYFETENFDEFLVCLRKYPDVELLHGPKTFSWLQRGVRIFDPDGHLIEVSESMYSVASKQFQQGKSVAETAELIQHPRHVVEEWFEEYQSRKH